MGGNDLGTIKSHAPAEWTVLNDQDPEDPN